MDYDSGSKPHALGFFIAFVIIILIIIFVLIYFLNILK